MPNEGNIFGFKAIIRSIYNLVVGIAASIMTLTETGGTLTTDGTEQDVYINNAPAGLYTPKIVLIDFTNHTAGETVVVKSYYRIKSGGGWIENTLDTYAGLQSPELIHLALKDTRYGIKVTAEKTAGGNQDYDWEVVYVI